MTRAPRAFAICTAKLPTPPEPPWMSMVWPGCRCAVSTNASQAVKGAHRHGCSLYKVERLWFRSHFVFLNGDVIGPAAAESGITVNRFANFQFRDVCACLLHYASDVVARDQREMRAEFSRVFAA